MTFATYIDLKEATTCRKYVVGADQQAFSEFVAQPDAELFTRIQGFNPEYLNIDYYLLEQGMNARLLPKVLHDLCMLPPLGSLRGLGFYEHLHATYKTQQQHPELVAQALTKLYAPSSFTLSSASSSSTSANNSVNLVTSYLADHPQAWGATSVPILRLEPMFANWEAENAYRYKFADPSQYQLIPQSLHPDLWINLLQVSSSVLKLQALKNLSKSMAQVKESEEFKQLELWEGASAIKQSQSEDAGFSGEVGFSGDARLSGDVDYSAELEVAQELYNQYSSLLLQAQETADAQALSLAVTNQEQRTTQQLAELEKRLLSEKITNFRKSQQKASREAYRNLSQIQEQLDALSSSQSETSPEGQTEAQSESQSSSLLEQLTQAQAQLQDLELAQDEFEAEVRKDTAKLRFIEEVTAEVNKAREEVLSNPEREWELLDLKLSYVKNFKLAALEELRPQLIALGEEFSRYLAGLELYLLNQPSVQSFLDQLYYQSPVRLGFKLGGEEKVALLRLGLFWNQLEFLGGEMRKSSSSSSSFTSSTSSASSAQPSVLRVLSRKELCSAINLGLVIQQVKYDPDVGVRDWIALAQTNLRLMPDWAYRLNQSLSYLQKLQWLPEVELELHNLQYQLLNWLPEFPEVLLQEHADISDQMQAGIATAYPIYIYHRKLRNRFKNTDSGSYSNYDIKEVQEAIENKRKALVISEYSKLKLFRESQELLASLPNLVGTKEDQERRIKSVKFLQLQNSLVNEVSNNLVEVNSQSGASLSQAGEFVAENSPKNSPENSLNFLGKDQLLPAWDQWATMLWQGLPSFTGKVTGWASLTHPQKSFHKQAKNLAQIGGISLTLPLEVKVNEDLTLYQGESQQLNYLGATNGVSSDFFVFRKDAVPLEFHFPVGGVGEDLTSFFKLDQFSLGSLQPSLGMSKELTSNLTPESQFAQLAQFHLQRQLAPSLDFNQGKFMGGYDYLSLSHKLLLTPMLDINSRLEGQGWSSEASRFSFIDAEIQDWQLEFAKFYQQPENKDFTPVNFSLNNLENVVAHQWPIYDAEAEAQVDALGISPSSPKAKDLENLERDNLEQESLEQENLDLENLEDAEDGLGDASSAISFKQTLLERTLDKHQPELYLLREDLAKLQEKVASLPTLDSSDYVVLSHPGVRFADPTQVNQQLNRLLDFIHLPELSKPILSMLQFQEMLFAKDSDISSEERNKLLAQLKAQLQAELQAENQAENQELEQVHHTSSQSSAHKLLQLLNLYSELSEEVDSDAYAGLDDLFLTSIPDLSSQLAYKLQGNLGMEYRMGLKDLADVILVVPKADSPAQDEENKADNQDQADNNNLGDKEDSREEDSRISYQLPEFSSVNPAPSFPVGATESLSIEVAQAEFSKLLLSGMLLVRKQALINLLQEELVFWEYPVQSRQAYLKHNWRLTSYLLVKL